MRPGAQPTLFLAAALVCACQSTHLPGKRLAPGQRPVTPALGLGHAADLATGVLAYSAEFLGERTLVTVELGLAFELVVRELDVHPASGRATAREVRRTTLSPAEHDIDDMAVDPLHARVFVASRDGRVRGLDLATGQLAMTWQLGSRATAVAVSPDGKHVLMGTRDGVLCMRRQRDGALLQCVSAHEGQISGLDVSASGELLASSSWSGEVTIWRLPTLAVMARHRFPGVACDVAFAPDGRTLAIARSAIIPLRSPAVVAEEKKRGVHKPHPSHAVTLWTPSRQEIMNLRGHGGPVTSVAWTPDGMRVISGSWDRTVRMWDVPSGRVLARYPSFSLLVRDVAMAPSGRWIAAAAWIQSLHDRALVLLDLRY